MGKSLKNNADGSRIEFSLENIEDIAEKILMQYPDEKVFLLYGEMGTGKTTLVKSLCNVLGSDSNVKSPTFSLINEYITPDLPVYHFDFYRIDKSDEALDLGIYDYLESGSYCFIEWPEKIEELLPGKYVYILLEDVGREKYRNIVHKNVN